MGSAISILPLHHPVQVAEDYAMVDVLSGGRLEFGMGIGNAPMDSRVYGVPREESRDRFVEALEIITAAWTQDRIHHAGRFWNVEDVTIYPRPVQQPHPPFWVAGTSPDSFRRAGQQGFNVMTVAHPFPPERLRPTVAAWREGLVEGGHDPTQHFCKMHIRVWVDENRDRARETAEAAIQRYDSHQRAAGIGTLGQPGPLPPYDWDLMLAQGRNVYGNPDDVIRGIETTRRNYDFDIFSATFSFGGTPQEDVKRAMRLFGKEVMPAFVEPARNRDGAAAAPQAHPGRP
jgi:alkanesulfonate monooxygenase SsuD/methylene tetrahydromethanopterin reductase-like flavin-dependent oxidoreductase (luciferase family)